LAAAVSPGDLPPDLHEAWQERAGIREFDGGLPRSQAEALALGDVLGHVDPPVGAKAGPVLDTAKADGATGAVQTVLFAFESGPYR
jgi:hypothetical protein